MDTQFSSYGEVIEYCEKNKEEIHSLVLNSRKFLSNKLMVSIVTKYANITTLSINYLKVKDETIEAISKNLNGSLTSLSARACPISDQAIIHLTTSCCLLVSLDLGKCYRISNLGNYSLPLLQYLCLYNCPLSHNYIITIGEKSPNLVSLDLGRCRNVNDTNVVQIVCSVNSSLTSLKLSECKKISDISLYHLSLYCFNLEHLDIDGCRVSDEGLGWIATQCVKLKNLNLRDIASISDLSIQYLGFNCTLLETLNIKQCNNLTAHSINIISFYFPLLKEINLLGYLKISQQDVDYLQQQRPSLKIQYQ